MPGSWACSAGSTLLIPSGRDGNHMFIVLCDPSEFEGYARRSCICVNVCTVRLGPYDHACILPPGCHPFIKNESYIAYRYARIDPAAHLERAVASNTFIPLEPISPGLLAQVRDGAGRSREIPRFLKSLLK